MTVPIRIRVGGVSLRGELDDSDCALAIAAALPFRGRFTVWGDQLTVPIRVRHEPRSRVPESVEVGDLAYLPDREALLIFFGPTPLSADERPVAPRPVRRVGSLRGAEALRQVKEAPEIVVEVGD